MVPYLCAIEVTLVPFPCQKKTRIQYRRKELAQEDIPMVKVISYL